MREERELALLLRRHQDASADPSTTALPSPHEVLPSRSTSSSSHRSKPSSRYSKTSLSSDATSDFSAPSEEGQRGEEEEDISEVKRKKSSSFHSKEGRLGEDILGQHRAFLRRGGAYRDPLRGVEKNEGSNRAYEKFLSQGVGHAEDRVVEVLRQARNCTRREEEETKKKKEIEQARRRQKSFLEMVESVEEEQRRDEMKDRRSTAEIDIVTSRLEKPEGREGELRGRDVAHMESSVCEANPLDHHTPLASDSSSLSTCSPPRTSPSNDVSSSQSISSSSAPSPPSSSSLFSSNVADAYFSHVHQVHMIAPPPKAFRDLHVKHLLLPSFSGNELYPNPSVLSLSPLAQIEERVLEKQKASAGGHHGEIEERKTEFFLPISQEEERWKGQGLDEEEREEAPSSRLLSMGGEHQNDGLPSSSSSSSVSSLVHGEEDGGTGDVDGSVYTPEKDAMMSSLVVTSPPSLDPLAIRRKDDTDVYEEDEEVEIFRQPWRRELVEEHAEVLARDIKAPGLLELQSQVKEEIERAVKWPSYTRKNEKKKKLEEERSTDASSAVRNLKRSSSQQSASPRYHDNLADTERLKFLRSSDEEDDWRSPRSSCSSSSSSARGSSLYSSSSSSSLSSVELTQHQSSSSSSSLHSLPAGGVSNSSSSCSSPPRLLETQSSLSGAPSLVLAAANARMRDRLVCQTYRRNRTNEDFLVTSSHVDSSSEFLRQAEKPISCSSSCPTGEDTLASACNQANGCVGHEGCRLDYARDETASCVSLRSSSPYRGENTSVESEEDDRGGVGTLKERRRVPQERKRGAVHLFSGEEENSTSLPRGMSSDISPPACKSSSLATTSNSSQCEENLACMSEDSSVYIPPEKREMDLMSDIFEEALRGEVSSFPSSEGDPHARPERESFPLALPREEENKNELDASLASFPTKTLGRRRRGAAPREQGQVPRPPEDDHRGEKTNEIIGGGVYPPTRSFSNEGMPSGHSLGGLKFEARDDPSEGGDDELQREIFLGGEVGEREQQDERGRRRRTEFDIVWKAQCAGLDGAEKLSLSEFSTTKKDLRHAQRGSSRSKTGERKEQDEERQNEEESTLCSSASVRKSNTIEEEEEAAAGEEEEQSPTISLSPDLNHEEERYVKKTSSPKINDDEEQLSFGVQRFSLSEVKGRRTPAEKDNRIIQDHHEEFSSSEIERRRRSDRKTKEMKDRMICAEEDQGKEKQRQAAVDDVFLGLDDPFETSRRVKKNESLIDFWRTEGGATAFDNYNGCLLPVQTQRYVRQGGLSSN